MNEKQEQSYNSEQVYFEKLHVQLEELRNKINQIRNDLHETINDSEEINYQYVLSEAIKRDLSVCWELLHESQYGARFIANQLKYAYLDEIKEELK